MSMEDLGSVAAAVNPSRQGREVTAGAPVLVLNA